MTAPAVPPAAPPPGGAPPAPAAPAPAAPAAPPAFDRTQLHPALRDMNPGQITELFETMSAGLRNAAARPAAAAPVAPAAPARPAPTKDSLRELFDPSSEKFDPEEAMKAIVTHNYGGLIGDINQRSILGMFGQFQQELPDFKEFQGDITEALRGRDPSSLTTQDVLNTYFAVKGMRQTVKEKSARAAAQTTIPPTPAAPAIAEVPLSEFERSVAHKFFGDKEDPEKAYKEMADRAAKGMTVKIPLGGGKSE